MFTYRKGYAPYKMRNLLYIKRRTKILSFVYVVVTLSLFGCAADEAKKMSQVFLDKLQIGMSIDDVQALARENYRNEMASVSVSVDTLIYYCRDQKVCAPESLEEYLRYVSANKNKDRYILGLNDHPVDDLYPEKYRRSIYVVHKLSLGHSYMKLGSVEQDILVFFDDANNKVIGWVSAGKSPIIREPNERGP